MNTYTKKAPAAPRFASTMTDDRGLSTVEYVVLLVLIVAASVGLWVNFGKSLTDKLALANTEFGRVTLEQGSGQPSTPGGGTPITTTPVVTSPPSALVAAPVTESPPAKGKDDR